MTINRAPQGPLRRAYEEADYADKNIRVNVVSPGIIATPMMDRFSGGTEEGRLGRMGRPEEIAGTVLWLCSDLAAFTTGANIIVDGGQTT